MKTFADLIRHGYNLSGHCRACSVHRDIDLTQCPPARPYVGARFKCRACGGAVMISLSKTVISNDAPIPALDRWRER
ncbi:hypothetical protein [Hoeflea sp.]|uniref:hypothetical protein n=1 Tax=Hoeflea sp. TaxID=1940281 RepID=UPI00199DC460|nr:hypothetical protein [Hoeflea sp.]MBC7280058.1 hypothetical protein [Hoeflea sp.]